MPDALVTAVVSFHVEPRWTTQDGLHLIKQRLGEWSEPTLSKDFVLHGCTHVLGLPLLHESLCITVSA